MKLNAIKIPLLLIASILSVNCFAERNEPATQTNGKLEVVPMEAGESIYTGKPYETAFSGYVFATRILLTGASRWMTADPAGFPDGANGMAYAPIPTAEIDYLGMLSAAVYPQNNPVVEFGGPTGNWEWVKGVATIEKGPEKGKTIDVYKPWNTPGAPDAKFNCFPFAFGHDGFWIKDPADADRVLKSEHKKVENPGIGNIAVYRANGTPVHMAIVAALEDGVVTVVHQKDGTRLIELSFDAAAVRYAGPAEYWE